MPEYYTELQYTPVGIVTNIYKYKLIIFLRSVEYVVVKPYLLHSADVHEGVSFCPRVTVPTSFHTVFLSGPSLGFPIS